MIYKLKVHIVITEWMDWGPQSHMWRHFLLYHTIQIVGFINFLLNFYIFHWISIYLRVLTNSAHVVRGPSGRSRVFAINLDKLAK